MTGLPAVLPFRRAVLPLLAACACLLLPLDGAGAAPVRGLALSTADQQDLHRIEAYLDGLRTLKGGFEQSNPDNSVSEGELYLSRPGRMRFDYAPPAQLSIVSNGDYLAVNDKEMKQVSFYPVESTPIWFLLREGIKLSGDVTITRFERGPGALRVTAVQTKDAASGSITLVFADQPLQLVKWVVVDAQQRSTTVAILDPEIGVDLPKELFRLPTKPVGTQPIGHP